jgi:hypothetical protein
MKLKELNKVCSKVQTAAIIAEKYFRYPNQPNGIAYCFHSYQFESKNLNEIKVKLVFFTRGQDNHDWTMHDMMISCNIGGLRPESDIRDWVRQPNNGNDNHFNAIRPKFVDHLGKLYSEIKGQHGVLGLLKYVVAHGWNITTDIMMFKLNSDWAYEHSQIENAIKSDERKNGGTENTMNSVIGYLNQMPMPQNGETFMIELDGSFRISFK